MERTSTRDEVNELDIIISGYMPDHMPDNFWKAYERLKQLAKQAAWPSELHEQYMKILEERDTIQEEYDELFKRFNEVVEDSSIAEFHRLKAESPKQ